MPQVQPETAFWLLSATAQAAAALAGLSALLLIFQVQTTGQGLGSLEKDQNPTHRAMTAKAWLGVMRSAGLATMSSLLGVGLSLGALRWVEPGLPVLPLALEILAVVALSLTLFGGFMLAFAVAIPIAFFSDALRDMANGMTWRHLWSELRRIRAEDRKRAQARWKSHPGQRRGRTDLERKAEGEAGKGE